MWLDFAFIFIGLLFLVPLLSLAKAQRKKTLAQVIPRAVETAKFHGWVSAGRLMALASISEKDAKDALVEASHQGLLFQADDGRYYPKQESRVLPR
jgi:hypothetical protein